MCLCAKKKAVSHYKQTSLSLSVYLGKIAFQKLIFKFSAPDSGTHVSNYVRACGRICTSRRLVSKQPIAVLLALSNLENPPMGGEIALATARMPLDNTRAALSANLYWTSLPRLPFFCLAISVLPRSTFRSLTSWFYWFDLHTMGRFNLSIRFC